jgi:Domain of unknown function (DUF4878)
MKKIITAVAFLSLALTVSCSNENGPEGVTEKFIEASFKANFEESKKYADEKTASMIDIMILGLPDDQMEKMKKNDIDVKIISSDVKDSTAVVKYSVVENGKDSGEKALDLKKINDEWKVSINKEGTPQ